MFMKNLSTTYDLAPKEIHMTTRKIFASLAVTLLSLGSTAHAANLPFNSAIATFGQTSPGTFLAPQMIDGITSADNGWAIFRNTGAVDDTFSERALFTLATPLLAGPQILVFTIVQNHRQSHVLETFRLTGTTAGAPSLNSVQDDPVINSALSTVAGTVLTANGALITVTGTLQDIDTYTITATFNLATPLTGFFLDAIDTNGDLTASGGPGRQPINGNFVINEFSVTAVPEPGTWVLMLGGLAVVAAGARRRRVI